MLWVHDIRQPETSPSRLLTWPNPPGKPNKSSRLDLDYDPNAGDSDDGDASQQLYLTNIDEDESSETLVGDDDSPPASTMDSRRAANGDGHTANVENGQDTTSNVASLSRAGSSNTFGLGNSTNDHCAAGAVCRKLVTMRLSDSGRIVTIELDASTDNHGIEKTMPDVGQNLTLRHEGDNISPVWGGINLVIEWQPPPIVWEPPLIISARDVMQFCDEGNVVALTTNANSGRVIREQLQIGASIPQTQERLNMSVNGLEPFIIPSILSLKVIKRNPTDAVGISFTKINGTIVIDMITPASLFAGTDLRPGYECLSINGHRIRSANRAAEIVRDCKTSLRLVASSTSHRPSGSSMYTMISLKKQSRSSSMTDMKKTISTAMGQSMNDSTKSEDCAAGMYFKMKHGLVKLVKSDADSPMKTTSMKVGDYILAINGIAVGSISRTVRALSKSNHDVVPILYFSMTQLRVSISDEVMDQNLWTKEWSSDYTTCVVSQIKASSNPITIQFMDNRCEVIDPSTRTIREKAQDNIVPLDHHLISVVETLNDSMSFAFSTIFEGVKLATKRRSSSKRASAKYPVRVCV